MTATTETTTARTCPPSAVADRILPWHEVYEGDAVLYAGHMRLLVAMWPALIPGLRDILGVRLLDGGETRDVRVFASDLTAVRRYTEGTSEREALVIAALDEAAEERAYRAHESCSACATSDSGMCDEHREHLDMAERYRAERDRREAGR